VADSSGRLPALAIPGLPPDSPGNYLASLGLLRSLTRKWPSVRIGWREGILHVVGGPTDMDELLDVLADIATNRAWTPYERSWADAQKKSSALATKRTTSTLSGRPFALWVAEAQEEVLEVFSAHVAPSASGRSFNPVLGKAGKIGQRDFAKGWSRAVEALAKPPTIGKPKKGKTAAATPDRKNELQALLQGEPTAWLLRELNAGSWFSNALKLYNTGQSPNREEPISPWLMTLACEGLGFLAGGASRRLGARAGRAKGAFPFVIVTDAAAPFTDGEAGRDSAEFWAPLWDRPMTLPEVRALFSRGRAEVRGHGVLTPSAFATAIVRRGVDAGLIEFRRFVFGWTTAQDYIEPRFEGTFRLRTTPAAPALSSTSTLTATSTTLERILALVDRLPRDRKTGQRWRFVGLRGPIEKAMLQLAAEPEDSGAACGLLDVVVAVLDRVDRTRSFRERGILWEPLPIEGLPALFGGEPPAVEARLALALVSGFPVSRPFTLYRCGVEKKRVRFEHPERPSARCVWGPGSLSRVLSELVHRRALDWESARDGELPARLGLPAATADVHLWLDGAVDERLLAQWISRLALFDWSSVPARVILKLSLPGVDTLPVSGALALFGMLHPLFDLRPVHRRHEAQVRDLLDPESGARTPATARVLASLVRAGQIEAAVRLASSRYAMAGAPLAQTMGPWHLADPERLLASLLFPIEDSERTVLIERWLRPRRQQGDEAHA
jgi:CRISPR-associated protein Csx17